MSGGRWAVVLGCSSGSGAAIARALARDPGLSVVGLHRGNHPEGLAEVRAAVEAAGQRFAEVRAEAGRTASIPEALAAVGAHTGPAGVKVLVHAIANASLGRLAVGPNVLHPKQFEKTFESMAHSFVYWVRGLLEAGLLGEDSRLLALSNAIGDSTLANCSAVAAAKAALEMYVRYLAWELGPLGHKVNALKYGTVPTAALQWIFPGGSWEALEPVHHAMHAAGRMITLEEVGDFASVLAGEKGRWFTGAVIDFTGAQMHSVYQVLCDEVARARRG